MIRQDDRRFTGEWIEEEGCAVMSCFFILNSVYNIPLTPHKIKIYVEQMKQVGVFTDDMDLYWDKFFAFFNKDCTVKFSDNTKYKLKKGEYSVGEFYNEKTNYTHFVVCYNGQVVYDPLGQSITVRDGKLKSYRIIKFK